MVKSAAVDQGVQIHSDRAYDLSALKSLGLGTAAIREARRDGLPVHRLGRRSFVIGSELIDHLKAAPVVGA